MGLPIPALLEDDPQNMDLENSRGIPGATDSQKEKNMEGMAE